MDAVRLRNISKSFKIYPRQRDRLKEALTLGRVRHSRDFWALRDIDLDIEKGTTFGLLGRNGAGKSTLLQVISGVLQPTTGSVEVNGKIALLQLGAGINEQFTGRENVMLNGMILGMERKKILDRFDEIEAFADIGEFMDQPVRTYSSGMRARLGFAVAVNVEPEILVVDETLSVGDAVFKHMCLQRMRELKESGTTIFFVSHSMGMVKSFCDGAALLHKGKIVHKGEVADTIDRYEALVSSFRAKNRQNEADLEKESYAIDENEMTGEPVFKDELEHRASVLRHGTGGARISHVEVLDERGAPAQSVDPEDTVTIRVHVEYQQQTNASVVHMTLRNKTGLDVLSTNTELEGARIPKRGPGERAIADFTLDVPFKHGPYSVSVAVSEARTKKIYLDWLDVAAVFQISSPENRGQIRGLVHIPAEVEIYTKGPAHQEHPA